MIHQGDLFDVLPTLEAGSIDACVTDPPYELGFMGKRWDKSGVTNRPETWREVYRVLKPGAHLLAFGGTRTFHRMTCAIEDAGFDIRDCLSWLYGQGFPKSLNLPGGLGTALKPSWEPIILARKPVQGTVAQNVEKYGTGALNIDASRIDANGESWVRDQWTIKPNESIGTFRTGERSMVQHDLGRWPANVVLDEHSAELLDEMTGELVSGANPTRRSSDKFHNTFSPFKGRTECAAARGADIGGASRFFYVAKPSREERDYGCGHLPHRSPGEHCNRAEGSAGLIHPRAGAGHTVGGRNIHPTVKPIALMRYLVRLVTPIGGIVLDPFTGSGTTGMACRHEQRQFIGIEWEAEYIAIAEARIAAVAPLFGDPAQAEEDVTAAEQAVLFP
jgi:DNA modification methylase